jgi:hydroxymethylpyrimidine/phosphomethylpyrimidine kinase
LHDKKTKDSPIVLSIAGFDPSSGAGITADLKTFAAYEMYGVTCPTLLTVQSTRGVFEVIPVAPELVADMLCRLAEDLPPAGVKIGALGNEQVLEVVITWLRKALDTRPDLPVVLDPVLLSTSGAALLEAEALPAFRERLLPLVTAVTPNLAEAALLGGESPQMDVPALALGVQRYMRRGSVIVTGGHLQNSPNEYLLRPEQQQGEWFPGEWVQTRSTHGTGCAFSSALLCELVLGREMPEAVAAAKEYVRGALLASQPIGSGRGPLHHLYRLKREL